MIMDRIKRWFLGSEKKRRRRRMETELLDYRIGVAALRLAFRDRPDIKAIICWLQNHAAGLVCADDMEPLKTLVAKETEKVFGQTGPK